MFITRGGVFVGVRASHIIPDEGPAVEVDELHRRRHAQVVHEDHNVGGLDVGVNLAQHNRVR